MGLFAMCELFPDFFRVFLPLLTKLSVAVFALPNLSTVVCAVLLERAGIAMRTYFSWCVMKNLSISWLSLGEKSSF
jgi:hypothetical protein